MSVTAPAEMLTIGAFAREARLSRKALQLYDSLGLLTPAVVDPQSGYRSYSPQQVATARLIGLLRQLDMPLARIARVLELPGEVAALEVRTYWQDVERDVTVKRRLAEYLERTLSGKEERMYDVKLREVEKQQVVTLTRAVYVKDLGSFIDEAHRDLYGLIARSGAKAGRRSFVIYHGGVNEDSDGPVEVCVPFEGTVTVRGDVRTREEPARREAYTTLTKAQTEFPGIIEAYDAVHVFMTSRGLSRAASPREVYFVSGSEIADEDPFCDVAWPVA